MIPAYNNFGATSQERIALFNSCTIVNIHKDYMESGRLIWAVYTSTGRMDGGFRQSEFRTRGDAITYALKHYPSLDIWAQNGDSDILIGNATRAICDARRN